MINYYFSHRASGCRTIIKEIEASSLSNSLSASAKKKEIEAASTRNLAQIKTYHD
ncbi:Alcohol dehydrogenase [NADP+] [Giardia duodenalis assemblage B]|uniref:Alcohol dehydrogenase [NADP+] n=1 Tax=Giardia duodenalis assemblage B TaxID=1394984 RepID=A0A132NP52_GIAIN|nr:Alcohol dehydrogenase [NADP+] [Giardia intestinalis assemblage B]